MSIMDLYPLRSINLLDLINQRDTTLVQNKNGVLKGDTAHDFESHDDISEERLYQSILLRTLDNYGDGLMIFLPSITLCSSSSIVSLMARPLVSGKNTMNNPHKMITIPNTPKERNFLLLPAATIVGAATPPRTTACLTTASAEFLTHVGNSSTNAAQAPKNATNSNTIADHPPIAVQARLHPPLTIINPIKDLRRLTTLARKKTTNADGSSDAAFSATLI
ncbi:hypothetical protein IEQ34_001533 [Dendrobium chrysotoxum]|uniref:Uncharacterized protein n=1 Tax=Dendrobium chrysotoxum TaxID=161865 RepID=A0AAV7HPB9_DENCH|nr:hypothetical protein IEQ34_001533 [Dendrobium chrysotoxum]